MDVSMLSFRLQIIVYLKLRDSNLIPSLVLHFVSVEERKHRLWMNTDTLNMYKREYRQSVREMKTLHVQQSSRERLLVASLFFRRKTVSLYSFSVISLCYFSLLFLYVSFFSLLFFMLFLSVISLCSFSLLFICYVSLFFLYVISLCSFSMLLLSVISLCYFSMLFLKTVCNRWLEKQMKRPTWWWSLIGSL